MREFGKEKKKDVLTAQKFDIFFYFIGDWTANNYVKEFEKLHNKEFEASSRTQAEKKESAFEVFF